MGADEDVDAVDLVEREAIDRAAELARADGGRRRRAEALRGQRDPPGGGEAEGGGLQAASPFAAATTRRVSACMWAAKALRPAPVSASQVRWREACVALRTRT